MTKKTAFGDTVHTPSDSPEDFVVFADKYGEAGAGGFYAARISDDPHFKWCASVDMNDEPGDLSVQDFPSEAAIKAWLTEAGVPEDAIEVET